MRKRVLYFDVANVIACFAVVLLHHNGMVHTFIPSEAWNQALLIEVLFYFAVPVFWMLSGATLLTYRNRYTTKVFLKKRLVKVFVPYVIWQLIWFTLHCLRGNDDFLTLKTFVDGFINNRFQPIYWFFPSLFVLYLLMPLLSLLSDKTNLLLYVVLILSFFSAILTPLLNWGDIHLNSYYSSAVYTPILYSLLGYFLSTNRVNSYLKNGIYITSVLMLIIRYWITYKMSYSLGITYNFLFSYNYLTALFPAISVFILIKDLVESKEMAIFNCCSRIASYSFGIYLIHKLVMFLEYTLISNFFDETSFFWRIPMAFVTWGVSLVVVAFLKKTKLGTILFP